MPEQPGIYPGPEESRRIAEEITREGFEGTEEGGAALVFARSKEEAERIRQRLESEGRAADLDTYLRLHKTIAVPKEEIEDPEIKTLKPGTAVLLYEQKKVPKAISPRPFVYVLIYIDREGNIAQINIDPDLLGEDERRKLVQKTMKEALEELKFRFLEVIAVSLQQIPSNPVAKKILNEVKSYNEKKAKKESEEQQENFPY